jgi:hypothetical protein
MKPYQSSSDKENCSPISSNCVIWQGPNISCINLCKGDSVSDIVYKLAVELCNIQANTVLTEPNGVSLLQLDCLLQLCGASTAPQITTAAVLQLIIDKICCTYSKLNSAITELEIFTGYSVNGNTGGTGSSARSSGSSEPILDLPPCLYYVDPTTFQVVTSLTLSPYVVQLASAFCAVDAVVKEHTTQIGNLAGRVTTLENAPCCYTPPSVIPFCSYGDVIANNVTPMEVVVRSLDTEYCILRSTLGSNSELTSAASSQCLNLNSLNALSQAGTMSSIPGWNNTINSFAQSMQNLWLTVCDMRGVINDLKNCCGAANCSSFLLGFTVGSPITTDELILVFDALTVIPSGYEDCLAGSTITVTDGNNTFTGSFLLIDDVINGSGSKTFNITTAGLNEYLPWTITVNGCIKNAAGTCNKIVSLINPPITTTTTTTTTAALCTQYTIQASNADLTNGSGTVYVTYYDCNFEFHFTTLTSHSTILTPCIKPGYIPFLYYIADGEPVPCSTQSTNTNVPCTVPV